MKLPGRAWIAIHRTQNRWHDLLAAFAGYCNDRPQKTGVPGEGGGYRDWRCASHAACTAATNSLNVSRCPYENIIVRGLPATACCCAFDTTRNGPASAAVCRCTWPFTQPVGSTTLIATTAANSTSPLLLPPRRASGERLKATRSGKTVAAAMWPL